MFVYLYMHTRSACVDAHTLGVRGCLCISICTHALRVWMHTRSSCVDAYIFLYAHTLCVCGCTHALRAWLLLYLYMHTRSACVDAHTHYYDDEKCRHFLIRHLKQMPCVSRGRARETVTAAHWRRWREDKAQQVQLDGP